MIFIFLSVNYYNMNYGNRTPNMLFPANVQNPAAMVPPTTGTTHSATNGSKGNLKVVYILSSKQMTRINKAYCEKKQLKIRLVEIYTNNFGAQKV